MSGILSIFPSKMADEIVEIGRRLRRTREAMKLNQAMFCRLVGIQQQAWNNYERGTRRISLDQALRVCKVTGVSLDWIYRGLAAGLPVNIINGLQEQLDEKN
ncbi:MULTISPECIES: helix-turn-helix transcriptional regulator [unclassified Bradyrhizobium]|uniref:helix-turn-helix domain-containing protein n=1 Tax=unclassified Bradyrhizobium TaxID=2631580 RepID=UPI0028E20BD7|nr:MULTISPECIES: helix-turn-helix transcriptional regulator [unclassified Bradyrhizobium]